MKTLQVPKTSAAVAMSELSRTKKVFGREFAEGRGITGSIRTSRPSNETMSTDSAIKGFTLVELIVTVAIVAILATVAYPSYREHVRTSHRSAAQQELLELAAVEEKIYLNSNAYSASVSTPYTGQSSGGLGKPGGVTNDNRYTVSVTVPADGQSFTLTATPVAGASQAGDGNLSVDSSGIRLWGTKNW